MLTELPKKWYIRNTSEVIREWFSKKYTVKSILDWDYYFIGYAECNTHNGVLGFKNPNDFIDGVEITFDDFNRLVLKPIDYNYLYKLFEKLKIC
jgi:hypothetical protein